MAKEMPINTGKLSQIWQSNFINLCEAWKYI